ncbi:MAG: hypothetical protein KTV77_02505 [Wolbachia endosymbiont of Fragariocoptes setiger]|nr:hypothetical protein [Wolbachia endosymbiont of Fragariocoptes setiger]
MTSSINNTIKHDLNLFGLNVKDITKKPSWFMTQVRKYSVNGTLPALSVSLITNFALAFTAAFMITTDAGIVDVFFFFLPTIKLPVFIACCVLGLTCIATFLVKNKNKDNVNDENINRKIRAGSSDEKSQIASKAKKIELVIPKKNYSIIIPISDTQHRLLEDTRQENITKAHILCIPYVLSTLIVVGAFAKVNFAHIHDGEILFVSFVLLISFVGIFLTLSQLKNNEIDHENNSTPSLHDPNTTPLLNILFPFWKKNKVDLAMESKFPNKKEVSLELQALDILKGFGNRIHDTLDFKLDQLVESLETKLLDPANYKIDETLEHLKGIRKDIKNDITKLSQRVITTLNNIEKLTKDEVTQLSQKAMISIDDVNKLRDDIEKIFFNINSLVLSVNDKVTCFTPRMWFGSLNKNISSPHNSSKDPPIGKSSSIISNNDSNDSYYSYNNNNEEQNEINDSQENESDKNLHPQNNNESGKNLHPQNNYESAAKEKALSDQLKKLDSRKKILKLENRILKSNESNYSFEKENKKLNQDMEKQKERDITNEAINNKPKDFFDYLIQSISLQSNERKISLEEYLQALKQSAIDNITKDINKRKEAIQQIEKRFENIVFKINWEDGSLTTYNKKIIRNLPSQEINVKDVLLKPVWNSVAVGCVKG